MLKEREKRDLMGICVLYNGDSLLVDGHCQNISSDYSILKKKRLSSSVPMFVGEISSIVILELETISF